MKRAHDSPPWAQGLRNHRLGSAADRVADGREGGVGVRAQRRDRGDAHNDDECQHNGVFHRGGAVFLRKFDTACEIRANMDDPFWSRRVAMELCKLPQRRNTPGP